MLTPQRVYADQKYAGVKSDSNGVVKPGNIPEERQEVIVNPSSAMCKTKRYGGAPRKDAKSWYADQGHAGTLVGTPMAGTAKSTPAVQFSDTGVVTGVQVPTGPLSTAPEATRFDAPALGASALSASVSSVAGGAAAGPAAGPAAPQVGDAAAAAAADAAAATARGNTKAAAAPVVDLAGNEGENEYAAAQKAPPKQSGGVAPY